MRRHASDVALSATSYRCKVFTLGLILLSRFRNSSDGPVSAMWQCARQQQWLLCAWHFGSSEQSGLGALLDLPPL